MKENHVEYDSVMKALGHRNTMVGFVKYEDEPETRANVYKSIHIKATTLHKNQNLSLKNPHESST